MRGSSSAVPGAGPAALRVGVVVGGGGSSARACVTSNGTVALLSHCLAPSAASAWRWLKPGEAAAPPAPPLVSTRTSRLLWPAALPVSARAAVPAPGGWDLPQARSHHVALRVTAGSPRVALRLAGQRALRRGWGAGHQLFVQEDEAGGWPGAARLLHLPAAPAPGPGTSGSTGTRPVQRGRLGCAQHTNQPALFSPSPCLPGCGCPSPAQPLQAVLGARAWGAVWARDGGSRTTGAWRRASWTWSGAAHFIGRAVVSCPRCQARTRRGCSQAEAITASGHRPPLHPATSLPQACSPARQPAPGTGSGLSLLGPLAAVWWGGCSKGGREV